MRLPNDWYKPMESNDEQISIRLNRTSHAARSIESLGLGGSQIFSMGEKAKEIDPSLKFKPLVVAAAKHHKASEISGAVAEWADGDAVAAHYGHSLDLFCTLDFGKSAGARSVLHASRRAWLHEAFGMTILTPAELANRL
jgi:hypothetical protein